MAFNANEFDSCCFEIVSTAKTHMKYGRKYAQDLQPFQTKWLQQHYGHW